MKTLSATQRKDNTKKTDLCAYPKGKLMTSVLFFADISESTINAQNLNAQNIIRNLSEDVEIGVFNSSGAVTEAFRKKNIKVVNKRGVVGFFRVFWEKCFKKYDYHFYVRTYESRAYWFFKTLFQNKAQTIHIVENMLPYPASQSYNRKAEYNAKKCDYVFSISKVTKSSARKFYGLQNVHEQKVGVNIEKTKKKSTYGGLKKVLCVGSLQKRKRPLLFAEYAKSNPDLTFHWFGNGPEKERCEAFVAENGLKNVTFFSALSHDEILQKYCEYDLFLFPSIHEGFGKVIIESMAAGVVPIVFNHYQPDMITHNVDGFVVEKDAEVNAILEQLKQQPHLLETMGKHAMEKSLEYDWVKISEKWEAFFKSAVNRNPS